MPHSKAYILYSGTSLINRLLPDEILIMIFLLLGPSSLKNPYVYLPLSWVCRHWRYIVLDTAKFWSVITHKCNSRGARHFIQDVIFRSKSHKVDVALCPERCCDRSYITSCITSSKRFEIRTLFIEGCSDSYLARKTFKFTQLENLILSRVYMLGRNQQSLNGFLSAVNPRFIEMPSFLLSKQISQSLNRLEWLKLDVSCSYIDVNASIVYHVLETLPSLRILNLISGQYDSSEDAHPAITLPNLRMFSLDPGTGEFCSIRTPALSYLAVSPCTPGVYDWDHLNSIDLSNVKRLRIAPCYVQHESSRHVACISTGYPEEDCKFFNNFHAPLSVSASDGNMNHHWTLPSTNSFHISFEWLLNHERLYSQLKRRATSPVELIVDCRSMKGWQHSKYQGNFQNFLGETLDNFDTITCLTVLRCRSFASICNLLMDGRRLPRLEQLSYDSSFNPTCGSGIVFTYMAMVQDARIEAGSERLKILELKKFLFIPQEEVEKIKKLEIQLIQYR